jgi:4-diphosphocytidyl-2-C-methyl-D-erythritol kinase
VSGGPDRVVRAAPAKINLYLHVVGRRPDGYHLLDSLVAFAGVHDTVAVDRADALTLTIDGPSAAALDPGGDNLVLEAARALAAAAGVAPRARIALAKRVPVAAGVGGGSADAAAALRALAALWGLADDFPLAPIALELGADVPVCLHGTAAFVGGIGEALAPPPALPPAPLLLVNPGTPLATARVFAARGGAYSTTARFAESPATVADLARVLTVRRNDLEPVARGLAPAVGAALDALRATPGCLLARMSGSGASCFALFAEQSDCAAAGGRLAAAHPDWWVAPTRLVADTRTLTPDEG